METSNQKGIQSPRWYHVQSAPDASRFLVAVKSPRLSSDLLYVLTICCASVSHSIWRRSKFQAFTRAGSSEHRVSSLEHLSRSGWNQTLQFVGRSFWASVRSEDPVQPFKSQVSTCGRNKGSSIFWCITTSASDDALMSVKVRFLSEKFLNRSNNPSCTSRWQLSFIFLRIQYPGSHFFKPFTIPHIPTQPQAAPLVL